MRIKKLILVFLSVAGAAVSASTAQDIRSRMVQDVRRQIDLASMRETLASPTLSGERWNAVIGQLLLLAEQDDEGIASLQSDVQAAFDRRVTGGASSVVLDGYASLSPDQRSFLKSIRRTPLVMEILREDQQSMVRNLPSTDAVAAHLEREIQALQDGQRFPERGLPSFRSTFEQKEERVVSNRELIGWTSETYLQNLGRLLKFEVHQGQELVTVGPQEILRARDLPESRLAVIERLKQESVDPNGFETAIAYWFNRRMTTNRALLERFRENGSYQPGNPNNNEYHRTLADEATLLKKIATEIRSNAFLEMGEWIVTLLDGSTIASGIFTTYSPNELEVLRPLEAFLSRRSIKKSELRQAELYHTHLDSPILSPADIGIGAHYIAEVLGGEGNSPGAIHVFAVAVSKILGSVGHYGIVPKGG